EHDTIEVSGYALAALGWRGRLGLPDLLGYARDAVAAKERLAHDELPQDHAQREQVGAPIENAPRELLGGHVPELAHDHTRSGLVKLAHGFRDAEVRDLDLTAERQEDVGRRDIPVHDAKRLALGVGASVRVVEPARRVGDDEARK